MKVLILSSSVTKIAKKYLNFAYQTSSILADYNYDLIFGACSVSMMGECYRAFREKDKKVYSYTTHKYASDLENLKESNHKIFETTFDMKKTMFHDSDLIIALPGGIGTISEVVTFLEENRSNDQHKKIVLFNYNHYYDDLINVIDKAIVEDFLEREEIYNFKVISEFSELINILEERGE